jgi:hypothetical protein
MESTRKALWLQRFLSFDPERSNRGKSVRLNELTRSWQNCKGLIYAADHAAEFYTISTINFADRVDYLSLGVPSCQSGAMP